MLDPVQVVLLVVILLLSILFIVLGIQIFFILRELRKTVKHATHILENTESITQSVSEPMNLVSGLLSSSGALSAIAKILKTRKDRDEE